MAGGSGLKKDLSLAIVSVTMMLLSKARTRLCGQSLSFQNQISRVGCQRKAADDVWRPENCVRARNNDHNYYGRWKYLHLSLLCSDEDEGAKSDLMPTTIAFVASPCLAFSQIITFYCLFKRSEWHVVKYSHFAHSSSFNDQMTVSLLSHTRDVSASKQLKKVREDDLCGCPRLLQFEEEYLRI